MRSEMGGSMPAPVPRTTELVIRNDIAQLAVLTEAMEGIGVEHRLAPKALFALQVGLDEMVSNVIKYAWPAGGSHLIGVRITVSSGQVEVEITDDGRAFNPLDVPAPLPPPGPRQRTGGRGVHMVKQLMTKIEYSRIDGRNCLKMIRQSDVGLQSQP